MSTTPEEMAETLAVVLDGSMGLNLTEMKWGVEAIDGLPAFYVRTRSGEVFRLTCEAVDLASEFDPFAQE